MRKVPLVIHLVVQESHRGGVKNHEADEAPQAVDKEQKPEWSVPERRNHLHFIHIPRRVGDEEGARLVMGEDRGRRELQLYPQPVHVLAQVRGGPEVVELSRYLGGKVAQQVLFPNVLRPETLPIGLQTRRLQAVTSQLSVRETFMRWYRQRGTNLPEEYMRCHCGCELQTYEHFRRCERYKAMDGPLARDQDIPQLRKREKGRREMGRELGEGGHRKGLWHTVIVKSLWRGLREHTVAPEVGAQRLLRRTVEDLQECMVCLKAQLEARAADMQDTDQVTMALLVTIGKSP